MHPVTFPGATTVRKPKSMTDEQCSDIPALRGIDDDNFAYFLTAWAPSYEDIEAIKRGEPIYVKTLAAGLPPMCLFTIDKEGKVN